jgi:hypothetical protein
LAKILLKSKLYEKVGWTPHAGQEPIIRSNVRSRVVAAGRRFGKSELGAFDRLLPEAFQCYLRRNAILETGKRWEYWIVGPEYTDSEKEFRRLWNAISKLGIPMDKKIVTDGIGSRYNVDSGDMSISLWNGAFYVVGKSAKYPSTLVGEGLRGVVFAEAAKLKASVYDKYVRPTLTDFAPTTDERGWVVMTSTPEGKNWFYDVWQRGLDPKRPDWASWRRPSWDNPHVYPLGGSFEKVQIIRDALNDRVGMGVTPELIAEVGIDPEIVDQMLDMTEERFDQEIGADFSEYVGRVFKQWDEEVHVTDLQFSRNPRWFTCAAVDYGWTNPFVWLLIQVDVFGNVYVLDELYETEQTIPELAELIQQRGLCPDSLSTFYPDPEAPGDTRQLSRLLKVRPSGNTGGPRRHRINGIRQLLKQIPAHLPAGHPDKKPRLLVDRRCKNFIREMSAYRYPDTKSERGLNPPEEPLNKDNHCPEALGRFVRGHFGVGESRRSRLTTTSTAQIG